jgi:signal transduction histidine kinase
MTPIFWLLRAVNLSLPLGIAVLIRPGQIENSFRTIILAAACTVAADAVVSFSHRSLTPQRNQWAILIVSVIQLTIIAWLSERVGSSSGLFDFSYLLPTIMIATQSGAVLGASAGCIPAAMSIWTAPDNQLLSLSVSRALFFLLVPAAAGLAHGLGQPRSAMRVRMTLARLRAAQVGEYISLVLFQVRDYLTTITSISEALALCAPKEDTKFVDRVERLKKTIGELNAKMSRLLGDKSALTASAPPTRSAIDLVALTRQISSEAQVAFAPENVHLKLKIIGRIPAARTDRRPIELALLAILQNAFEACASHAGSAIRITLRHQGSSAFIEVADNAGGLSPEAKASLFEPLSSTRRGHTEMGLGLAMSRRFIERLGGDLQIKSGNGRTIVTLTLPLSQELPKIRREESTWAGRRSGE